MVTKGKYYNRTNTCDRCEINFDIVSGHPYREYNKEGNWTGKYICTQCYGKDYYHNIQKYDPNGIGNIRKLLRDRRTGSQNPNSPNAKGDLFEELTCRWREVKSIGILNDNYTGPVDHSRDSELGIIQTKGKLFDPIERRWSSDIRNEHDKNFNNLIYYCASKDGRTIDRIYIFPEEEIKNRTNITIYKNPNPSRGPFWYNQYRIIDEKELNNINDLYQKIKEKK